MLGVSQAVASSDLVDLLLEGARYADLDDVKQALAMGAHVDCRDDQGRTGLHMASANGCLPVVNLLLESGADVNAENEQRNTPLHYACLLGHTEVVQRLLAHGACVSALNSHERSPVDEALGRPHQDAVLALVDSWGQKAQAADAAGDELEGTGIGTSTDEHEQQHQTHQDSPVRKHLPPESMELG